jgi:hypothetical protein
MNICPTCKRKIPSPRLVEDKRLVEDTAQAKRSLAVLESALANPYFSDLTEAIQNEQTRLVRALSDRKLLWSIFRKGYKGKLAPYWEEMERIAA